MNTKTPDYANIMRISNEEELRLFAREKMSAAAVARLDELNLKLSEQRGYLDKADEEEHERLMNRLLDANKIRRAALEELSNRGLL